MDIEFGNAHETFTSSTGWFIGYSEWAKSGEADLRYVPPDALSRGLCVKWMRHWRGDPRGSDPPKPISEGRSINMMVSERGALRIQFSESPDFPADATREHLLQLEGDFCAWGAGLYHRSYFEADCTILTL